MTKPQVDVEAAAGAFKALADESRLRIMLALVDRELCVCQMVNLLGLAPPTVSRHLQVMKDAGLLEGNKRGRWVYYRFRERPEAKALLTMLRPMLDTLHGSERARSDRTDLNKILKIDPTELCRRLNRC